VRLRGSLLQDPDFRLLAPMALVNTFGNGIYASVSAIYFAVVVGIPVARLGAGLTAAALAGILLSIPIGRVVDRRGATPLLFVLWSVEGAGVLTFTVVRSFALFLPLICLVVAVDRAAIVAFRAYLARGVQGPNRIRVRAGVRSLANLGTGLGAGLGGLVLAFNSHALFTAAFVADALTFFLVAGLSLRLRLDNGREAGDGAETVASKTRARPWRDRPYLLLCALAALLATQNGILELGLPLWVTRDTLSPRWIVGLALLGNTMLVAALQLRFSRGTQTLPGAARAFARGGVVLAFACAAYASASRVGATAAACLLLLGVVVQTLAELWFSAGVMTLSMDLAPEQLSGAYQGFYTSCFYTGLLLSPVLMTNVPIRLGIPGWGVLACLYAGAGIAGRRITALRGEVAPRPLRAALLPWKH
jgi:MFS family permease